MYSNWKDVISLLNFIDIKNSITLGDYVEFGNNAQYGVTDIEAFINEAEAIINGKLRAKGYGTITNSDDLSVLKRISSLYAASRVASLVNDGDAFPLVDSYRMLADDLMQAIVDGTLKLKTSPKSVVRIGSVTKDDCGAGSATRSSYSSPIGAGSSINTDVLASDFLTIRGSNLPDNLSGVERATWRFKLGIGADSNQVQADLTTTDTTLPSFVRGKDTLFDGNYASLSGIPANILTTDMANLSETLTNLQQAIIRFKLGIVTLTGQIQANWLTTDVNDSSFIRNKPHVPELAVNPVGNATGDLTKLSIDGTIYDVRPAAADIIDELEEQTGDNRLDISAIKGIDVGLLALRNFDNVLGSTIVNKLTGLSGNNRLPASAVRGLFSGSYNDLTDKPTIPNIGANPQGNSTAKLSKLLVGTTIYSIGDLYRTDLQQHEDTFYSEVVTETETELENNTFTIRTAANASLPNASDFPNSDYNWNNNVPSTGLLIFNNDQGNHIDTFGYPNGTKTLPTFESGDKVIIHGVGSTATMTFTLSSGPTSVGSGGHAAKKYTYSAVVFSGGVRTTPTGAWQLGTVLKPLFQIPLYDIYPMPMQAPVIPSGHTLGAGDSIDYNLATKKWEVSSISNRVAALRHSSLGNMDGIYALLDGTNTTPALIDAIQGANEKITLTHQFRTNVTNVDYYVQFNSVTKQCIIRVPKTDTASATDLNRVIKYRAWIDIGSLRLEAVNNANQSSIGASTTTSFNYKIIHGALPASNDNTLKTITIQGNDVHRGELAEPAFVENDISVGGNAAKYKDTLYGFNSSNQPAIFDNTLLTKDQKAIVLGLEQNYWDRSLTRDIVESSSATTNELLVSTNNPANNGSVDFLGIDIDSDNSLLSNVKVGQYFKLVSGSAFIFGEVTVSEAHSDGVRWILWYDIIDSSGLDQYRYLPTGSGTLYLHDVKITTSDIDDEAVTEPKLAVHNSPSATNDTLKWDNTNSRMEWGAGGGGSTDSLRLPAYIYTGTYEVTNATITGIASNYNLQTACNDGTYIYTFDGHNDTVNAFTKSGARHSSGDISNATLQTAASNINPTDIETDGTTLYVTDRTNKAVWAFTTAGARDSSKDISTASLQVANSAISPAGITWDGSSFLISDLLSGNIYGFTKAGGRVSSKDITATQIIAGRSGLSANSLYISKLAWDGTSLYAFGLWGSNAYTNKALNTVDTFDYSGMGRQVSGSTNFVSCTFIGKITIMVENTGIRLLSYTNRIIST